MTRQSGAAPSRGRIGDTSFGAYYFANCCGKPYLRNDEWLAFFGGIADRIVRDIAPGTVLDAGCAIGLLVETLRDRGVDATGLDISSYAIDQLHETVRPHCRRASIADDLGRRYDLIVCIEVLEHMPAAEAEAAVENFCRWTDDVLFSSSPLDRREPTHINVHPPEHWAELFARHDFFRDTDFDATFVTAWAARFRRRREPVHRVARGYERRFWELLNAEAETRDYSMHQQNHIEALQQQVAALEGRVVSLQHQATAFENQATGRQQQNAALQARIAELEAEAGQMPAHLTELQQQLAQAKDRIFHMERSAFWKARDLWIRLTKGGRS